MQDDLFVTNVLIGIIAGVHLIVLVGLLVGALYMKRLASQVQSAVGDVERKHVAPLRTQVERILADVSRISARADTQAARVEATLSDSLDAAERQVRRVQSAVGAVTRETTAVASGVRAAVAAVTGRQGTREYNRTAMAPVAVVVSEEDRRHASQ